MLGGAILGFLSKTIEGWFRQHLTDQSAVARTRRDRLAAAVELAYWPSLSILDDMVDFHPDIRQHRVQLRRVMRTTGFLLDVPDAEHLWLAVSERASFEDLVRARGLFEEAAMRKRVLAQQALGLLTPRV